MAQLPNITVTINTNLRNPSRHPLKVAMLAGRHAKDARARATAAGIRGDLDLALLWWGVHDRLVGIARRNGLKAMTGSAQKLAVSLKRAGQAFAAASGAIR